MKGIKMTDKKLHKILLIVIFSLITLVMATATVINCLTLPERPFSETENRYLQKFPEFNFDTVTEKTFMSDFESYFSDRVVLREDWIRLMNSFDRMLGKREIKGVFTEDGRMIEAWKSYDADSVNKNLAAMQQFAETYDKKKVYFMLAPTAQDIYSETLPANCGAANQKAFIKMCYDSLPSITGIDVYTSLSAAKNDYIYYRTDHHWTSYGAFLGYEAVCKAMQINGFALNDFNIEHAANDFRGTLYSKTLDNSIQPDVIDIYTLATGEPKSEIKVFGEEQTYDSLYQRDFLEKKDKYSTFLGLNTPKLDITTENLSKVENDSKLLIIKDSYANALIPFLSKHYSDITVLDLRYINGTFESVEVNVNDYDAVLFVYNVITFSQDTNVSKLSFMSE